MSDIGQTLLQQQFAEMQARINKLEAEKKQDQHEKQLLSDMSKTKQWNIDLPAPWVVFLRRTAQQQGITNSELGRLIIGPWMLQQAEPDKPLPLELPAIIFAPKTPRPEQPQKRQRTQKERDWLFGTPGMNDDRCKEILANTDELGQE